MWMHRDDPGVIPEIRHGALLDEGLFLGLTGNERDFL